MFDVNDDSFKLTNSERKTAVRSATLALLYMLLAAVVLITGASSVMLVLSQVSDVLGFTGLWGVLTDVIRVSFPVTVEAAAVVAGLGFISARWRKNQIWVALAIEVVWVIFAAANMITFFAVERGIPLQTWQNSWISYGLAVSALVAGILAYALKRADPDNQRLLEQEAAVEQAEMIRFSARRDVAISPQMRAIEKQKGWLDFVKQLRLNGYTEAQINFILADTPELLIDKNKNGRPDLLEDGNRQLGSGGPVNRPAPHAPQPLTPRNEEPHQNGVTRRVEAAHWLDNDADLYREIQPQRPQNQPVAQPTAPVNGVPHNVIGGAVTGDEEDEQRPFPPR